MSILSFFFS